jgi:putative hydrolase of the HAD superfamily
MLPGEVYFDDIALPAARSAVAGCIGERSHVGLTHIIFDLDETLYPRSAGLFDVISRRITHWVQRELGLTSGEAAALRQVYLRQHGTTLGGLIANQQVGDVESYLAFVHDVPVERYIGLNPALATMLAAIPLRKVIFTNATAEHGRRVLRALGVGDQFERLVGARETGLVNKPRPEAYHKLLLLLQARGPDCILVDDRAVNLRPAKALGMTTVLVDSAPDEGVDFVVEDVLEVGPLVARLLWTND